MDGENEKFIMIAMPALLLLAGIFSIVCAWKDYDWFMEHKKAKFMARILGRKGARIFYIVLGTALTAVGVFLAIGVAAAL